jgi:hypothetical protein
VMRGQPHRLDLPIMSGVATLGGPRIHTELQIPIRDIVGTAGAGDGKFDRDFVPTDERSRGRFLPSRPTVCRVAIGSPTATTGWRSPERSAKSPSRRTSPTERALVMLQPRFRTPNRTSRRDRRWAPRSAHLEDADRAAEPRVRGRGLPDTPARRRTRCRTALRGCRQRSRLARVIGVGVFGHCAGAAGHLSSALKRRGDSTSRRGLSGAHCRTASWAAS